MEASFKDPNLLEEELKAAAAKEKETARKEEAKATKRSPKEKDLEAWKSMLSTHSRNRTRNGRRMIFTLRSL